MGAFPGVPRIYEPPNPATYSLSRNVVVVSTIDGHRIATREFTPFALQDMVGTLIFSHGNADDIGSCASYCQWLSDSVGARVIAYDYVGYGRSDVGETTVDNMAHAAEAVFGYATTTLRCPVDSIVVVGKSLGSAAATWLASQTYCAGIAGLVLISPIASGARVVLGSTRLPRRVMSVLDDQFAPNIKLIGRVQVPVLLVHGVNDELVNVQNSHDLFNCIQSGLAFPPLWLEAGHNDIESLHKSLFISTLVSFVCHCLKRQSAAHRARFAISADMDSSSGSGKDKGVRMYADADADADADANASANASANAGMDAYSRWVYD
jgi:pimeloyl-ACP methyl ester carboxylesterase